MYECICWFWCTNDDDDDDDDDDNFRSENVTAERKNCWRRMSNRYVGTEDAARWSSN